MRIAFKIMMVYYGVSEKSKFLSINEVGSFNFNLAVLTETDLRSKIILLILFGKNINIYGGYYL